VSELIWSDDFVRIDWSDTQQFAQTYGTKAATSLAIPRAWTLPYVLISVAEAEKFADGLMPVGLSGAKGAKLLSALGGEAGQLIIRSSVVGETIWDRGSYLSMPVTLGETDADPFKKLAGAARQVLASATGRAIGLMIQRHLRPLAQGEFGNLQRVSKTRDQWEVATREPDGATTRLRLNSQRDPAADPD
jgi:hypothetical protein